MAPVLIPRIANETARLYQTPSGASRSLGNDFEATWHPWEAHVPWKKTPTGNQLLEPRPCLTRGNEVVLLVPRRVFRKPNWQPPTQGLRLRIEETSNPSINPAPVTSAPSSDSSRASLEKYRYKLRRYDCGVPHLGSVGREVGRREGLPVLR